MKRDRGFTLVELLLAVTLLSMLMALTYGGLQAATRATDRGQKILQESGRLRMAHQFVRKQINQAIPLGFNQQEDVAAAMGEAPLMEVFFGLPGSVRFVGPMPGYLGFGGPQVQELNIVNGDNGLELVLTHALLQGFEDAKLDEREPIVLIDHIESAEFRFLARDEEGELAGWVTDWEETAKLPVAVALDIQFEEGAYTAWPLLVAVVKVDASSVDGSLDGDDSYQSAVRELIEKRRQQN
ncbi:MAG TPA: prepilin-type N-terminal cleavage/methylation domain-containing protein [Xanthomonadales bacterium]|nr:prepilin-type N-terminal cleavage/methylation domain-containing protein [Xanthomonadales bacterium]